MAAHKWNTTGYIILLMLIIGFFFAIPAETQELIIDRDTIPLYSGLEKVLGGAFVEEKPITIKLPSGKTITTVGEPSFKIVKVTNISGNNPFHQTQPVFNFGGVQVATVADLVDCIQSGKCASNKSASKATGEAGQGGIGACCKPDRQDLKYPTVDIAGYGGPGWYIIIIATESSLPGYIKPCEWQAVGIMDQNTEFGPLIYFSSDPKGTQTPPNVYVGVDKDYLDVLIPPSDKSTRHYGRDVYVLAAGKRILMVVQDKKTKQKFKILTITVPFYETKNGKTVLKNMVLSMDQISCIP